MKRILQKWKKSVFFQKDKLLEDFNIILTPSDNDTISLQDMPDEIILKIFEYLSIKDLGRCAKVSTRLKNIW